MRRESKEKGMALYLVLKHYRDEQKFTNQWRTGTETAGTIIESIETTAEVVEACREEKENDIYIYRCGFKDDSPIITCRAKVDSIKEKDDSKFLIIFKDQKENISKVPKKANVGMKKFYYP